MCGLRIGEWQALSGGRYGANSLFSRDPLFVDADANDYRYAPGSPAFSLGVPQSDAATASGVGLRPSFPYLHALPARAEAARANPGEP